MQPDKLNPEALSDLYEATQAALELVETDSIELWRSVPGKLRAALSKARGEASSISPNGAGD